MLNKRTPKIKETPTEQAVIIRVPISDQFGTEEEQQKVYALEDSLTETLQGKSVGFVDGNDFGQGEANLYLYGSDADTLFSAIRPTLRTSAMASLMQITLRYGSVNDPDPRVVQKDLKD